MYHYSGHQGRLGIEQRNSTASAVRSSQAKQLEPQVDELPSSSMDKVVPSGFGLSGPRNVSASTIGAEIRNADPVEFKELEARLHIWSW